jgi:anion-transporting  ArsA/GET3 family ATPase
VSAPVAGAPAPTTFAELVDRRRVVVCCGTGGVGKTTAAAVLGIEAARRGRRVVVVTIDPARRLASALGLAGLSAEPTPIDPAAWDPDGAPDAPGRLWALMLDAKTTFDRLVLQHATTPEQGERILGNAFYRNISTALSGTQEYMAMEQLHELHVDERFDLVVVDTPPSRHALDFLDAPNRLARLLDNRFFRLLMAPTRLSLRAASAALSAFLRIIARVVGSEVVDDVSAFFRAFEGMEQGFRERSRAVSQLLASDDAAFVLVTSPRADAVHEALYFADRLSADGLEIGGLIVNRVLPTFAADPEHWARWGDAARAEGAAALASAIGVVGAMAAAAEAERAMVAPLLERTGAAPVAEVPVLAREVADVAALSEVGTHVFGRAVPSGRADGPTPTPTPAHPAAPASDG